MNLVQLICCALLTKFADIATDKTIGTRIQEIVGSRRLTTSLNLAPAFDELKIAGSEICVCPPQAMTQEEATRRRLRNYQKGWQKKNLKNPLKQ